MSHHLLAKACTRMALADLFGNKQMIGSKPVAHMWPMVSSVRVLYHTVTRLVLPLPKKGAKIYKQKGKKNDVRFIMRCKMMLGSQSDAKIMKKDVIFAFE